MYDEKAWEDALVLFAEAAEAPVFHDHSGELLRRQLNAFPRSQMLDEELIRRAFGDLVTQSSVLSGLGGFIQVEFERRSKAGDRVGMLELSRQYRQLMGKLIDSLRSGHLRYLSGSYRRDELALIVGLRRLGEVDEAAELEAVSLLRDKFNRTYGGGGPIRKYAGVLVREIRHRDIVAELSELEATRMAEYAWADRVAAGIAASILVLFAGLAGFEILRRPKQVKGLARGLMPLLGWRDQVWIGVLGIVVPWLWWWGWTHWSPLGLRDFSLLEWDFLPWTLQNLMGLLLVLVMLTLAVQWRWGKCGKFLGLRHRHLWLGCAVATATALAIPAIGAVRYLTFAGDDQYFYMLGVAAAAGFSTLWLLWGGIMGLIMPRTGALRGALTCRTLLPWFMATGVLMVACMAVLVAVERYWFAKDTIAASWTSETHLNALEERMMKQ